MKYSVVVPLPSPRPHPPQRRVVVDAVAMAIASAIPNGKSNANPNTNPQPTIISSYDLVPEDLNIPDNYVSYTLKTQKSLPPVSWSNYTSELNWLNVAILIGSPILGFVGAWFTKLRWETALFSVFYYYFTGLGMS